MSLPPRPASPRHWAAVLGSLPAVWCGFVVVHVVLMLVGDQNGPGLYGDPHLYGWWVLRGLHYGDWPVIAQDSVYPLGALIPMTLPTIVTPGWTQDFEAYRVAYELLVVLMNGLAVGTLLRTGRLAADGAEGERRDRTLGAWWWLVFLLCLGPISLTRLDGIAAPLTIIALAQLVGSRRHPDGRPALAAGLATFGAWIKIAPGAAWLAVAATAKRPWRQAGLPALVVTAVLVVPAAVAILATGGGIGGLGRIASFLGEQDGRGLQSESAGATVFSVARLWGSDHVIAFNEDLNTWEIVGPGTQTTGKVVAVLLVIAVGIATWATWRAARRIRATFADDDARRVPLLELTLFAAATLTIVLFVFNKVGSPQFMAWLAAPVAVALTALRPGDARVSAWRTWAGLAGALLVVGLLTQQLFPAWYGGFIDGDAAAVLIAALRNVLVVALGAWLFVRLLRWRVADRSPGGPPGDGGSAAASGPATVPGPQGRGATSSAVAPNRGIDSVHP